MLMGEARGNKAKSRKVILWTNIGVSVTTFCFLLKWIIIIKKRYDLPLKMCLLLSACVLLSHVLANIEAYMTLIGYIKITIPNTICLALLLGINAVPSYLLFPTILEQVINNNQDFSLLLSIQSKFIVLTIISTMIIIVIPGMYLLVVSDGRIGSGDSDNDGEDSLP